jgi:hypothetical protein
MKKTALYLELMRLLGFASGSLADTGCPDGYSLEDTEDFVIIDDGESCPDGYRGEVNNLYVHPSDTSALTDSKGTYSVDVSTICSVGN